MAAGAHSGMEECKFQFGWERWNCPESALQLSTHNRLRSGECAQTRQYRIPSPGCLWVPAGMCSAECWGCSLNRMMEKDFGVPEVMFVFLYLY